MVDFFTTELITEPNEQINKLFFLKFLKLMSKKGNYVEGKDR